ncbi:meiotic recombination protein Ski8/Rec14 [Purpureocillium lilacinum]|uniref:Meiotic recombination protein Ski8/Rec14 n=1 Tax=Purpureocillium lilacinum TaxID=33203 RepID=A0A179GSB3_PURLI|nr:meiotic recombination protein Ski8/Rec14 [Purpureocillium lilacinum]
MATSVVSRLSSPSVLATSRWATLYSRVVSPSFLPSLAIAIPGVSLNLPTLDDIWESVLRAVPKNKVSHSRKRHRQMAGKALKDVNNLCKCPGCGETKRTHRLCQRCLEDMKRIWREDYPTDKPNNTRRTLRTSQDGNGSRTPGNIQNADGDLKSKQYLTTHTVDDAHITDIFSLATTPRAVLSASGSSTLHVHDTTDPAFPLRQSLSDAHKLGCHHVCTSRNGKVAASAGFGGEVKLWSLDQDTGDWRSDGELAGSSAKPGEVWALALSEDGGYLATTTNDGRINVWDVRDEKKSKIQEYETGSAGSGSFGMSVDLSRDGKYTASGHQSGAVYIFNNDTGRILYSLTGLAKPVRAVAFSPGSTRLAAAGDAGIIALYDMKHGEHVGNLTGHSSWITSLDWSDTGEFLLTGSMDGKVKVWSIERSACVATHSETDKALWAVRWLPKTGKSEMFCTAGAHRSLSFYREATGG